MAWSYWHRVELFRIDRGRRVLEHVEDVDDHGPYVGKGVQEYAQVAAEDHLTRWTEPPGRWLVALWQLRDGRKFKRLCEVELHWRGPESVKLVAGAPA